MPLYLYKCSYCGKQEPRVAGVDDRYATCTECHNVMSRIIDAEDIYKPYWFECLYDPGTEKNSKEMPRKKTKRRRQISV